MLDCYNNGLTSTTTIPSDIYDTNKVYISLTGDACKLTDIKAVSLGGEPIKPIEPEPGKPDETDTSVNAFEGPYTCEGFWGFHTSGMEVTAEGIELEFKARTKLAGTANYHTPIIVAYSGKEPKVNGNDYKEFAVIRSDNYAWAGAANTGDGKAAWESAGYKFESEFAPDFANWETWLAANKSNEGVNCKVSAIKGDGKVTITFVNHTVKSVTEIPYSGDGKFYISVSGEQCVFGKTLPDPEKPKPLAPYPIPEVGTGSGSGTSSASTPAPVPTIPPADEDNKDSEGAEMDFGGFWTAHFPGIEVTESGTALTYRSETHSSASEFYHSPNLVAYSSNDATVHEAGYPGYDEYAVIRADSYAWVGAANTGDGRSAWDSMGYTFQTSANDSAFSTWVADNKAGVNGKVQAIKADGKIYIEFTNGSITTLTSFPAPDGKKVYISLSGEECKVSKLKQTAYTGINGVSAGPAATATPAASAEPTASATPTASTAPTTAPDNTNAPTDPGTTNAPSEPVNTATPEDPSNTDAPSDPEPEETEKPEKKTMKLSGIKAKTGTKKVTGTVSVKKATVKVKVGNKDYKKAKVNGKKFTFTASSKLKKGTKITIKVTKSGYKAVTKTTKVK